VAHYGSQAEVFSPFCLVSVVLLARFRGNPYLYVSQNQQLSLYSKCDADTWRLYVKKPIRRIFIVDFVFKISHRWMENTD
jgi:hypothetical protein